MRIAYFDLICGAAGDMILASMIDAGLNVDDLKSELLALELDNYELKIEKTFRHHISATYLKVEIKKTHSHRSLADIEKIIDSSNLNDRIKDRVKKVFKRLARAEARVHGETIDTVHFHEVGMVDAIIDIAGAAIGLELLGIDEIYSSPLTIGSGTVSTRHGTMPVPAPATAELIKGFPSKQTAVKQEILTPTGAAILTTLAEFLPPPSYTVGQIGYGAGRSDHQELPNLLRLFIGNTSSDLQSDEIAVLETNLDRTTPEQIGYLFEQLFRSGALDVFITSIQMKKNRPGQLLTVLSKLADEKKLADIILGSGCTLGIRRNRSDRWILSREEKSIDTKYGRIPVKLAYFNSKTLYFPEYDFVAKAAAKSGKNFDDIYFEILSQLRKET